MTLENKMEKRLEELGDTIGSDDSLVNKVMSQIETHDTAVQHKPILTIRKIIMNRYTKLAAAAVIAITIFTVLQYVGIPIGGTSVAWADVLENISKVQDYTYRHRQISSSGELSTGYELKDERETIWFYSSEFGTRWDLYMSDELVSQYFVLLKQQKTVWINLLGKTYKSRDEEFPEKMFPDPKSYIKQMLIGPHKKLGQKTIEGILTEGFELKGQKVSGAKLDNAVSRLWVDVKTQLPILLEASGKYHNSDTYTTLIQDQFEWNVNLTEADFTPDISEDFVKEEWPKENNKNEAESQTSEALYDTEIDFSPLSEYGLLFNEEISDEKPIKKLNGTKEIYLAQDVTMKAWPDYSQAEPELTKLLDKKLDINSLSIEELVQIGCLLREKFWDAGGCLSANSYKYGYMSRILLELAYDQKPFDLLIGDELAETIMTSGTIRVTNGFAEDLIKIRAAQFEQIIDEVKNTRKPSWEDFACGCDLAYLCSIRDPNLAIKTVDWLIANAEKGGWEACLDTLNWMRPLIEESKGVGFNIYIPQKPGFPEEFRYGGRPPSFKGPKSRIIVPIPQVKGKVTTTRG